MIKSTNSRKDNSILWSLYTGFNFRKTDSQCCLLPCQLKALPIALSADLPEEKIKNLH